MLVLGYFSLLVLSTQMLQPNMTFHTKNRHNSPSSRKFHILFIVKREVLALSSAFCAQLSRDSQTKQNKTQNKPPIVTGAT